MQQNGTIVKIAVDDKSGILFGSKDNDNLREHFRSYLFQISKKIFKDISLSEDGAKVLCSFVEDSQNCLNNLQIGEDPFERTYLFLYIAKIKSCSSIPRDISSDIKKWIKDKSIVTRNWGIILLHEDGTLFRPSKNELVAKDEEYKLLFVNYKRNLSEQSIDNIKHYIQAMLIKSFSDFDSMIHKVIQRRNISKNESMYYESWRYLYLRFLGFIDDAYNGFIASYEKIMSNIEYVNFSDLPIIDTKSIETYPLKVKDKLIQLATFALIGAMNCNFYARKFDANMDLFLKHMRLLLNLCKNENELRIVYLWAEKTITSHQRSFKISESKKSDTMECLYRIALRYNLTNLETFKETFFNNIDQSRLNTKLANEIMYFYHHNSTDLSKLPEIKEKIQFWTFGVYPLEKMFNVAMSKRMFDKAVYYASLLLDNTSLYKNKCFILDVLQSCDSYLYLNDVIQMSPGFIIEGVKKSCFSDKIMQYCSSIVNIKLDLDNEYKNLNINCVKLILQQENERISFLSKISSLNEINRFDISIPKVGKWIISSIEVEINSLVLQNSFSDFNSFIIVTELVKPTIKVNFPRIIIPNNDNYFDVNIDLKHVTHENISLRSKFSSDAISIPYESYDAKLDNEDVYLHYNENMITFDSNKTQVSLASHMLSTQLKFTYEEDIKSTQFLIDLTIDQINFEYVFDVSFKLPLEISLRFLDNKFMHVCLISIVDVPIILHKASISDKYWPKSIIKPYQSMYFLTEINSNIDTEYKLNIDISEENKPIHTFLFDIKKQHSIPTIEYRIDGNETIGEFLVLTFTMPSGAKGKFKFDLSENNYIVCGTVSKNSSISGEVSFTLIPLKTGYLELPRLFIDDKPYMFNPSHVKIQDLDYHVYPFV